MKYLITIVFSLLFIPSVSFASPLTQEQAMSLISVVQSSTTTPASAFTSLITAFSNITEVQAISLIAVVQAAPGVPADSFVNLLISFTQDTIIIPTVTIIEPVFSPSQTILPEIILPEPEIVTDVGVYHAYIPHSVYAFNVFYLEGGKEIEGTPITVSTTDGEFESNGEIYSLTATQETRYINVIQKAGAYFQYYPITGGERIITIVANGITETKKVRGEMFENGRQISH